MKNVSSRSRSGAAGKLIFCPKCFHASTVYHFAWSSLGCPECHEMSEKRLWIESFK